MHNPPTVTWALLLESTPRSEGKNAGTNEDEI